MSTNHTLSSIRFVDKRAFWTSLIYDHVGALVDNIITINRICVASISWILTNLLVHHVLLLFVDDSEVPLEFAPISVRIYLRKIYHFGILTRINLTNNFRKRASKVDISTIFGFDCNANNFVQVGVVINFEHNYTRALVFRIHVILVLLFILRVLRVLFRSIRDFINIHLLLSRRNWNILTILLSILVEIFVCVFLVRGSLVLVLRVRHVS